jgi:hypothetical protein
LKNKNFIKGDYNTSFIKTMDLSQTKTEEMQDIALMGAAIAAFERKNNRKPVHETRRESQWKLAGRKRFLDSML